MAINVDLTKPLSEATIADLRTRLPENIVQHYIEQAGAEKPKPSAKAKDGDILT